MTSVLTAPHTAVACVGVECPSSATGGFYQTFLPGLSVAASTPAPLNCEIAGTSYPTIPTYDNPDPRPDTEHADLNLSLRGYERTGEHLGLVVYGGDTDQNAPQLPGLFSDQRTPTFRH